MKVIVQIPCLNEAETIPRTIADIPRDIPGVDSVEILIVDDGSNDDTVQVARSCGVDHIIQHRCNRGLAQAFRTGMDACLQLGADIIVNTDGDNQYAGADLPRLVAPILEGKADIVIGDRRCGDKSDFSYFKRILQKIGSAAVRRLSGVEVPDAVSGFRAFSREAALQINIISPFSYTIETLIQAGKKRIATTSVPVATNPKTRESRLFRSVPEFIAKSSTTMVRMYTMFEPLRIFFYLSVLLMTVGVIPVIRFLYFYFTGRGDGHVQSLVLGGVILLMGFLTLMIGVVADLISFNRQLVEMTLEKVRRLELDLSGASRRKDREQTEPQAKEPV